MSINEIANQLVQINKKQQELRQELRALGKLRKELEEKVSEYCKHYGHAGIEVGQTKICLDVRQRKKRRSRADVLDILTQHGVRDAHQFVDELLNPSTEKIEVLKFRGK